MTNELLHVVRSVRVPGLGLLVLPAPPGPAWLLEPTLHTTLGVHLHRPGQPPRPLLASIEEVTLPASAPTRALLLTGDMASVEAGDTLEILEVDPLELLALG